MIKTIVFDFDGLILDTESSEFEAWQEVYQANGVVLPLEVWKDCIGRPQGYFDPFAYLEGLTGRPVDREKIKLERRARSTEFNLKRQVLPGVNECIRDAERIGIKLGMASSSDRAWVYGHLERLGLFDSFKVIKCAEDTETHKPEPGPYLAALEELGCDPLEAMALEDSPNGVRAASAAGMKCVAVPSPLLVDQVFHGADIIIESLALYPLEKLLERLEYGTEEGARGQDENA